MTPQKLIDELYDAVENDDMYSRSYLVHAVEDLCAENTKLRELVQRLLVEYRYLRVRPRKMYLQHEARMRAIEEEMRELGIEVDV